MKMTQKAGLLILKLSARGAEGQPVMEMVGSSRSIQEARMLGKQLLKYGHQLMQLDTTLVASRKNEPMKEQEPSGGRMRGIGDDVMPPPGAVQE